MLVAAQRPVLLEERQRRSQRRASGQQQAVDDHEPHAELLSQFLHVTRAERRQHLVGRRDAPVVRAIAAQLRQRVRPRVDDELAPGVGRERSRAPNDRRVMEDLQAREARVAAADGTPLMRALALDFPDDPEVWSIQDQYLFGRDLLISPLVVEGKNMRAVYLPGGAWFEI